MNNTKSPALVSQYKAEINAQLADKETLESLLQVTFKGLEAPVAKRAMLEGYFRGFTFTDFLKKNVYAIPFKTGYSLVTSIDYARKIAQKSSVWQSKPDFEVDDGTIVSCTVTAFRRIGQDVAEYPATVFFEEYSTNNNLWLTKPRTMIAKVAEMHALRKACPEEMSQLYTEEEFDKERETTPTTTKVVRRSLDEDDAERPNLLIHQNNRGKQPTDVPADVHEDTGA